MTLFGSIELPLRRRWSEFGLIVDPTILIEVRTVRGYRGHEFLIDTGAEASVAPRRLAQEIGLEWDTLSIVHVVGVGPGRMPTKRGLLPIRLGGTGGLDVSIQCLFVDQPNAPQILGCADVLDRFALTIDTGRGKIILTEIP